MVCRHLTPITPSLRARSQSIAASIQKLPDSVVKSLSSPWTIDVSGETISLSISLRFAVDCFTRDVYKILTNVSIESQI